MSLRKHIETFKTCLDADEELKKFELEDIDEDKVRTIVYIRSDYAVCIEVYDESSDLTNVAGTIQITTVYPNWITDKVTKNPNRWWKLINHLDLMMGTRHVKDRLPDYSEWPQLKALVDFILDDNDEQIRLESEALMSKIK